MKKILFLLVFVTSIAFAQNIVINEVQAQNANTFTDEFGKNPDWIELYNPNNTPINLNDFGLSDDVNNLYKYKFTHTVLPANSYLLVAASGKNILQNSTYLHTNFKLSNNETVYLTNPSQVIIDSISCNGLYTDVSKGKNSNNQTVFYLNPTPNQTNDNSYCQGVTPKVKFSLNAGYYSNSINLALNCQNTNATIHYTLNGDIPTESSTVYTTPILIDTTTSVRAKAFLANNLPSVTTTQSYIINNTHTLPIICLTTEPKNLFDDEYGIYVEGLNPENPNYKQDWERPAHIEMFETNGEKAFDENVGIKIHGYFTRRFPLKSLAIFMRSKYGKSSLNYKLFPNLDIDSFESFILRNSGSDWNKTMCKDAFITSIYKNNQVKKQAYRPAVIYINGKYWGILNIREKINEHFVASHYNINHNNINLLHRHSLIIKGSNSDYIALTNFIKNNSLTTTENYNYVKSKIDIENFMYYYILECFIVNKDWPGNNIKFWQSNDYDNKWRWILYDTDCGFSVHYSVNDDMFEFLHEENSPYWNNPNWATLLIRKLLENEEFKQQFIVTFEDQLNSTFLPDTLITQLDEKHSKIASELLKHYNRWQLNSTNIQSNLNFLKNFINSRPNIVYSHMKDFFNLGELKDINLNINNKNYGSLKINSINLSNYPWNGKYFEDYPVKVTAIPKPGYKFVGWQQLETNNSTIEVNLNQINNLTAIFALEEVNNIVINEINYNSANNFDCEDWIELYNPTPNAINISAWVFKDSLDTHQFQIPDNTIINSNSYLVLCKNETLFTQKFTDVTNYIGNFDFGLSGKGERIRLFNNNNQLVDFVEYDDNEPWPTLPDGNGPTLELKNYNLDNNLANSWQASTNNGTPGMPNSAGQVGTASNVNSLNIKFNNYPNPFNPKTTINFTVLNSNYITNLSIFNVKGQKIKTLINKKYKAGNHSIVWNGLNKNNKKMPSGIYFYKITNKNFSKTNKMLLLK